MNEIERAIKLISKSEIDYSGVYDSELNESVVEVILNTLREKVEREKGCEFCTTRAHRILRNALYCPVCGRRLEVEHI
jgi:tRNA(Ile2) C34 agmatinyltransferase TiaS